MSDETFIHPNLKLLSHSSRDTLHSCPRFYQIYKLSRTDGEKFDTVDTAFGKVVGLGTQMLITGASRDAAIWAMFNHWRLRELDPEDGAKKKKSFYWAVAALDSFAVHVRDYFSEWKVAHFGDGRPASELGYMVDFGDGFVDRGKLDLVLEHRTSGELLVYEGKTTARNVIDEAMYQNSDQALGYGVVLDTIAASLGRDRPSSYRVLYFVYDSRNMRWIPMPFVKSRKQRAQWVQNVLLDKSVIQLYASQNYWPMRGESCYKWSRCQYFGICNLSLQNLLGGRQVENIPPYVDDESEYQFKFNLLDVLDVQLEKLEEKLNG